MTTTRSDILLDRMMSLHPKIIDLTLDRMWRLLEALGHPERALPPVVHIAGTNGKGSTLAMIRAGLEGSGYRVHAYTSPHLVRFHERIRLAGTLIEEDALSALLDECLEANGPDPITYFEITTAAAILAFSRHPADFTLLEVGLGGRLDATNVIEAPRVTVITPVDLDHQQYLGDSLEEIAGEKAGIIKRGRPCIVGRQRDAALDVIEARATRLQAPLAVHGQHWHASEDLGRLVYQDESGLLDLPLPTLPGAHQIDNAGVALAVLRELGVPEAGCEAAMQRAVWPARLQRLRSGPLAMSAPDAELWLDGGHNPHAGLAIAAHLATLPPRRTFAICGMLGTKDVAGYLTSFGVLLDHLYAVAIPGQSATLDPSETVRFARDAGIAADVSRSVTDALTTIIAQAPQARVLICGSLYLAGDVLRENG